MRLFTIEETGFPDLAGMMLATVQALKMIDGSAAISELDEKVVELEGCSEEEQSFLMNDGNSPRLNYYLAWARTYLKKGGAIENSGRGVWALTSNGSAISEYGETKAIYDAAQMEERERAREKRRSKDAMPGALEDGGQTAESEIDPSDGTAERQADWDDQL